MISNGSSKIYFIGIDKIINNELNDVFKVEDLDELRNIYLNLKSHSKVEMVYKKK